jgi:hypothetical protein
MARVNAIDLAVADILVRQHGSSLRDASVDLLTEAFHVLGTVGRRDADINHI